ESAHDASAYESGDASAGNDTSEEGSDPPVVGDCAPKSDEHEVVGYGENATGGGSTNAVVVSTFEQATEVLDDYRKAFKEGTQTSLVVRYTGTFDFDTITDVCAQHTKDA